MNIQKKVSDTILQRPKEIILGGKRYEVAPPTIGTLIRISDLLGDMPVLEFSEENALACVLSNARQSRYIPEIAALLILGAKKADKKLFWIIGPTLLSIVSKRLANSVKTEEISVAISDIISTLGVGDFFAISTFLQGLNITKPTKVETQTKQTRSGQ